MRVIVGVFSILILLVSFTSTGLAEVVPNPLKNLTEISGFTTREPRSAEFFNDYLFIADSRSLLVYNTSDPENPTLVTEFTDFYEPKRIYGLSISDGLIYVAADSGWIYVIDITNPERPRKLYQLTYLNAANDVAISGEYMYVADTNTGMLIFNLSNRREPELVGKFYVLKSNISGFLEGWGGRSVDVSGNYAFLSGAQRTGFFIIDVSDPTTPVQVYQTIRSKSLFDIAVMNNDVYLAEADGTSQFTLLDVSNPYIPKITGDVFIYGSARRSAIAVHPSGYIYAASDGDWHIFRTEDLSPPTITIKSPADGELTTSPTITVSGTAFDRSGIAQVLVNGEFAGTETWSRSVSLVSGNNMITVTASDARGNSVTQERLVQFTPSVLPTPTTPVPPVEITPEVLEGEGINGILRHPAVYVALAVVLIVVFILYQYRMRKIRKQRLQELIKKRDLDL